MEDTMTKLYLAIPCYNEEEVLRDSAGKLLNKYLLLKRAVLAIVQI